MISTKVQNLIPYTAGEQINTPNLIKLNTNENAYPPSPAVGILLNSLSTEPLKLYPDPECSNLVKTISEYEKVEPQNIFVGNGSDEVLAFAFLALFEHTVAYPAIGYSFYPVYADLYNLNKNPITLNNNFTIDLNKYNNLDHGVILANPNAPTSLSVSYNNLLNFVKNHKHNIIVDEAYIDFATRSKSLASIAPDLSNLLVVKTLSKSYALAGLRCGYAVGNTEFINALNKVKNSFNSYTMDYIAQNLAAVAIKDTNYHKTITQKIINTRENTKQELIKNNHTVLDSDANFLFIKHNTQDGETVYKKLKEQNILVRHFSSNQIIAPYVRVTIGTDKQMQAFLTAFNKL